MLLRFLATVCIGVLATFSVHAQDTLAERLTPEVLAAVFPDAESLGPEEGEPPAIAVSRGGAVVGYIFSTYDVVRAPGYSTTPFDVIAGVELDGRLTGAVIISHREPYLTNFPVRRALADEFLANHAGFVVDGDNDRVQRPAFVKGATISARAMRGGILDSARLVLRGRGGRPVVSEPTLDREGFRPATWDELVADGAVARRLVTFAEMRERLAALGATSAEVRDDRAGDAVFTDLTATLVTPPRIGRNLLGGNTFTGKVLTQPEGSSTVAIFSSGPFNILGNARFRAENGYRFDRLQLVQDGRTFTFDRDDFERGTVGSGMPGQNYGALFTFAADSGFDPLRPWTAELLVPGETPQGPVIVTFPLAYELPPQAILMPPMEPVPAWVEAWEEAETNVIILGVALILLTGILVFQGRLTRNRLAHRWIRNGFLLFTLLWLGWTASAQLSIVNVVNYLRAPFENVGIGFYLAEPLIVMIALYTLVSLVILGRGVFCGWLCPFGALQELLAQVARAFKLPQWNPSDRLQKYLWLGKYVSAAVIIGLAFVATEAATAAEEVEPFKTAITSVFTRPWPYVAYAGVLLFFGLFTERGYCRFLCPLGGVLALLDRLHLVDMLKRRPECGSPCQLCARSCPVKAIMPSGKIKMAECFQCLDCQVEYYDDHRCPPLARARKLKDAIGPAAAPLPIAARAPA